MYDNRDYDELCIPIYKCSSHDWIRAVVDCCEAQGYEISRDRSNLRVWKSDKRTRITDAIEYVEAIRLAPEDLDVVKGEQFIGLTPVRLYFENGSGTPSSERENLLLRSLRRPKTNSSSIIDGIIGLGNMLAQSGKFDHLRGEGLNDEPSLISLTSARGASSTFPLAADMWSPALKNGWRLVLPSVNIHFVADGAHPATSPTFTNYQAKLAERWAKATKNGSSLNIKAWGLESFLERARSVGAKPEILSGNDVVVIAVTGARGDPLPPMQAELMAILDGWGQQYRIVSLTTKKSGDYWLSNHALSILNAVGVPYSLKLPFPEDFSDGAFFGVDIGHDREKRLSKIVVTVMSPGGRLIAAVSRSGIIDESISGGLIRHLLQSARDRAEEVRGKKFNRAIVFRDGRLPNNNVQRTRETVDNYINAMGIPTSLVELRKNQNPPIFRNGEQAIAIGACFNPGMLNIRYATFYDSKVGMANTFKVVTPEGGDALGWGVDAYVKILCGLCYTPSLGSQPHLPGPIYWADGFGITSSTDNRFRGHNVHISK
ncbi:MAG: Piwi domain-containing protein [Porticoccaceae bacterium]